jgi:hypothetical protein
MIEIESEQNGKNNENFREAAFSPTRRLSVRLAVTKSPEKLRKTWAARNSDLSGPSESSG